jgi:hypothetical protein
MQFFSLFLLHFLGIDVIVAVVAGAALAPVPASLLTVIASPAPKIFINLA